MRNRFGCDRLRGRGGGNDGTRPADSGGSRMPRSILFSRRSGGERDRGRRDHRRCRRSCCVREGVAAGLAAGSAFDHRRAVAEPGERLGASRRAGAQHAVAELAVSRPDRSVSADVGTGRFRPHAAPRRCAPAHARGPFLGLDAGPTSSSPRGPTARTTESRPSDIVHAGPDPRSRSLEPVERIRRLTPFEVTIPHRADSLSGNSHFASLHLPLAFRRQATKGPRNGASPPHSQFMHSLEPTDRN